MRIASCDGGERGRVSLSDSLKFEGRFVYPFKPMNGRRVGDKEVGHLQPTNSSANPVAYSKEASLY